MPVRRPRDGFYKVEYTDTEEHDAVAFQFSGMKEQEVAYAEAMKIAVYREHKRARPVKVTVHYVMTELVYHTDMESKSDRHH